MKYLVLHKALGDHNEPLTIVIEHEAERAPDDVEARDAMLSGQGDQFFDALLNVLPGVTFDQLARRLVGYVKNETWWKVGRGLSEELDAATSRVEDSLRVVLDQVDYTAGNCRPNEMVSAVLSKEVIAEARSSLAAAKQATD